MNEKPTAVRTRAIKMSEKEITQFAEKLTNFKKTLSGEERKLLGFLMPQTPLESTGEAASAGGVVPDATGSRQIDKGTIRNGDGSTTTCPPNCSTRLIRFGNGPGDTLWVCLCE